MFRSLALNAFISEILFRLDAPTPLTPHHRHHESGVPGARVPQRFLTLIEGASWGTEFLAAPVFTGCQRRPWRAWHCELSHFSSSR
jgi:hypothetical protein